MRSRKNFMRSALAMSTILFLNSEAKAISENDLKDKSIILIEDDYGDLTVSGIVYISKAKKVFETLMIYHDEDAESGLSCPSLNSQCKGEEDQTGKISFDGSRVKIRRASNAKFENNESGDIYRVVVRIFKQGNSLKCKVEKDIGDYTRECKIVTGNRLKSKNFSPQP